MEIIMAQFSATFNFKDFSMNKTLCCALILFASSSTALAQDTQNYEGMASDFVTAITQSMKDPSSAQIKDVVVVQKTPTAKPFVCATVNGKNSYGAYNGYQLYHGTADKPRSKADYDDPIIADLWPRMVDACTQGPFVFKQEAANLAEPTTSINVPAGIAKKLEAYATLNNLNDGDAAATEILKKHFGN